MLFEEALEIIDRTLEPGRLNNLQELVLRETWTGKTYQEIASAAGYDPDYIRGVGFHLWQALSRAFGEKVSKNNVRSVLRQHSSDLVASHPPELAPPFPERSQALPLELPEGWVPLDSPWYVPRPPIEERCCAEILKPGAMLRLRAPYRMGKTSLKKRILAHAAACGCHTVSLDFDNADEAILNDLDRFLRWFSVNISRQLSLEPKLDEYWGMTFGSKLSCTLYFQNRILEPLTRPLVLALDEVNRLFEYPAIAKNFFPLLRSWYEEAKDSAIWQKLHLIVAYSTEIYVPLSIDQSPFNVGLSMRLPELTREQVLELARRHGLSLAPADLERLLAMVGGHPYLIRLALYHLACGDQSLDRLLQDAPTLTGIYRDCLHQQWKVLQEHPDLLAALQAVVTTGGTTRINSIAAYKLESLGLVQLRGNEVHPSCQLYCRYFRTQLGLDEGTG
jgi:hypothetical protein